MKPINITLTHNIACVHKKPTPLQIVKVDYPARSAAVVKEAYFKQPSTTDYNGVYKGKYIDFEAKETKNKTSFPLQNFHLHQIEHMKQVVAHNGIAFVIIKFTLFDEFYLLDAKHIIAFWNRQNNWWTQIDYKTRNRRAWVFIIMRLSPSN